MSLDYALFENHLTADPSDYMAVVQNPQSKTEDDIVALMVSRGSTVTKADALATIEQYAQAIEEFVKDGYNINTALFKLSLSVKGIFDSEDENFNPARHSVKVNVSAGTRLQAVASSVKVSRVQGTPPQPDPVYLDDLGSGTRNETLTPGNIARLKGSRLKFDASDPAQGIFLVASDGSETQVATVSHNKPSQLDFLVPVLPAGTYRLEVRAVLYNTTELRKGSLSAELTVG
jgi:hypothetical protein